MKNALLLLTTALLLTSCNVKREVQGAVNGTGETISGDAKTFNDPSGKVMLHLSSGVDCEGRVNSMQSGGGSKGRLDCTDGRGGPITVLGSRTGGHGFGDLDGQNYKFTFGSYN